METKHINVSEGIWEFCKYQNDLLKRYKEFIEKTMLVKIVEKFDSTTDRGSSWFEQECRVHEVEIPSSRFMVLETPNIKRQWEILNWDQPLIKPEIYLNVLYKAMEEQVKNAETN